MILYYIILDHIILYYIMLYYIILDHIIFFYIMLYYIILLYYIISYYIILYIYYYMTHEHINIILNITISGRIVVGDTIVGFGGILAGDV